MDRALQIWFCFWLKLIIHCLKRDWKVAKIALKMILWGPLRGWYPELGWKKAVVAKTLAYFIGPHNDLCTEFEQNRLTFISKSATVSQAEALKRSSSRIAHPGKLSLNFPSWLFVNRVNLLNHPGFFMVSCYLFVFFCVLLNYFFRCS